MNAIYSLACGVRNTPFFRVSKQEHCWQAVRDRPWWVHRREENPLYRHSLFESVPDSLKFTNHRWRPFSAGSPAFLRSRTSNTGAGVRKHSGALIRKLNHDSVRCGRNHAPGGGLQPRGNAPSVDLVAAPGFGSCPADGTLKLLTKTQERKGFFFPISGTLPLVLITMPSTDRPTDKKASRVHWTRRSRGRVAGNWRSPPPTSAHITTL